MRTQSETNHTANQAREDAGNQVAIGESFASDWLREWGKFPQNKANPMQSLSCKKSWILSRLFYLQVAIDIFKGITDEDARYLAEKLEFQGPLLEEVG